MYTILDMPESLVRVSTILLKLQRHEKNCLNLKRFYSLKSGEVHFFLVCWKNAFLFWCGLSMLLIVLGCCHLFKYFNTASFILHGVSCVNVWKISTSKAHEKAEENVKRLSRTWTKCWEQITGQLGKSYAVARFRVLK